MHRRKGSRGDRGSSWWICGAAESRASGVCGARIVDVAYALLVYDMNGARSMLLIAGGFDRHGGSALQRRASGPEEAAACQTRRRATRKTRQRRGLGHGASQRLDIAGSCILPLGDELDASWPRQLARRNQHAPTLLCHQYHCWISRLSRDCEQRARRERGYNE